MGQPLYFTDPVVANAYHVHPAEFAYIDLDVEAQWLIDNHHAYPLNHPTTLPAAYYVHPDAPNPFVPFPDLSPPDTKPALMTAASTRDAANVFSVTFSGGPDAAPATGYFVVVDTGATVLAYGTWPQPAGTTPDQAATLLQTALGAFGAVIATQKFGPRLELRGTGGKIILSVDVRLRVPIAVSNPPAPPPPPPPPPPPAPAPQQQTIGVGPEDTHTKIDVDGDGKTDVHVVVDRPPQNP
ncbi:MAG TPA: hypothetical protein VN680_12755 [Burkholderiaceae bacterium]|nr:hypothetical protein [Burkholderiaceae bacterium]